MPGTTLNGMRASIEVNSSLVRRHGWLAAADVRDVDRGNHALMGAQYETEACILDDGGEWIDDCLFPNGGFASKPPSPTPAPPGPYTPTHPTRTKQFNTPSDLVEGDPFTVYAGLRCDLPSFNANGQEKVERKFDYIESRQIDFHMARLIAENGNPLGDCPLSNMIMNADYTANLEYGSYAIIAMSAPLMLCAAAQRLIFPCPPDACVTASDMWRTVNGTYVTQIAHDDRVTTSNFFLTGAVTLLRGPKNSYYAPEVRDNVGRALCERVYVPLIECMAYHAVATCDAPVTP